MNFLRSVFNTAAGGDDAGFVEEADCERTQMGEWTLTPAVNSKTGEKVTLHRAPASSETARSHVATLKKLRHPQVLHFLHTTEVQPSKAELAANPNAQPQIVIATERCRPLRDVIAKQEMELASTDARAFGLTTLATVLNFLNVDAVMVHGSIGLDAVAVTQSGDWRLTSFGRTVEWSTLRNGAKYGLADEQAQMLAGVDLDSGGPWSVDLPQLVALVTDEIFGGRSGVPTPLRAVLQRAERPKDIAECDFLRNHPYVRMMAFIDELPLKTPEEKEAFFGRHAANIPPAVQLNKVLPKIVNEQAPVTPAMLASVLTMAGRLPDRAQFALAVQPFLLRQFAANDRGVRLALLENLDKYVNLLATDVVSNDIFPALSNGFVDEHPVLREATVKATVLLIGLLRPDLRAGPLMRHLAQCQMDTEAGIRTNTTICLSKIAPFLAVDMRKSVLLQAFTRALRDPFAPARSAGLLSLSATIDMYSPADVAARLLPAIAPLLLDQDTGVRQAAHQCASNVVERLRNVELDAVDRPVNETVQGAEAVTTKSSVTAGVSGALGAASGRASALLAGAASVGSWLGRGRNSSAAAADSGGQPAAATATADDDGDDAATAAPQPEIARHVGQDRIPAIERGRSQIAMDVTSKPPNRSSRLALDSASADEADQPAAIHDYSRPPPKRSGMSLSKNAGSKSQAKPLDQWNWDDAPGDPILQPTTTTATTTQAAPADDWSSWPEGGDTVGASPLKPSPAFAQPPAQQPVANVAAPAAADGWGDWDADASPGVQLQPKTASSAAASNDWGWDNAAPAAAPSAKKDDDWGWDDSAAAAPAPAKKDDDWGDWGDSSKTINVAAARPSRIGMQLKKKQAQD